MKDVTLNNGEVMTDAEYIERYGMGDVLTEFVATKEDLVSLEHNLVEELLGVEFLLELSVCRSEIDRMHYIQHRLERVIDFLPELEAEVQEKLRRGREKYGAHAEKIIAESEAQELTEGQPRN